MITSACTVNPPPKPIVRNIYIPIPISLPEKPEIPKIPGKDLSCLNEEVREKLLSRDRVIKGYISDLETTIVATQKK